jgi:hypothetical protein
VALLLLLNAIFNFFTWPTFFRRVAKDPRARDAAGKATAFFTVHLVLCIVGVTLGVVSAIAAVLSLTGVW